jgi:hypothetical protein
MLRDVLLSLVKLMFGGCAAGSQEDLLAIQAACLKHIVLTVPDLVQAENRQRQKSFCRRCRLQAEGGESLFASSIQVTFQPSGQQCWGSVTFWCGSGSADSYLRPLPDSFFYDFRMQKIFYIVFSYNLPAGTLSSVLIYCFKAKFFC